MSNELRRLATPSVHFPRLSIRQNGTFIDAPEGDTVSPTDPTTAQIFYALSLERDAPPGRGSKPLSPTN